MPFIETDLVKFIVLVIPGILGMWVYKPFVYRGDDREHGHHDTAIALILGLCGYLAALTVPGLLGFEGGLMTSVCVSCVTSFLFAFEQAPQPAPLLLLRAALLGFPRTLLLLHGIRVVACLIAFLE